MGQFGAVGEGGEAGLATSSGMGAITSALWTLLQAGDAILADRTLYGCTYGYLAHGLARLGIEVGFADFTDLDADGDTNEPTSLDAAGYPRFEDDLAIVDTGMGTPPMIDMGAFEFVSSCPADLDLDRDASCVNYNRRIDKSEGVCMVFESNI